MVEFNKVSNESYFIKNLLYSTYLPLLRTVKENDYIIKDRLYIYKCNIIKCISSGYIPIKNLNINRNEYPKSVLRKSDDQKIVIGQVYYEPIGNHFNKIVGAKGDTRSPKALGWFEENIATFKILGEYYFGERNGKFCSNFLSSSEGYDYKTHEKLGFYLRALRDMYGLNLMPLYNCFSNQPIRNIHISNDKVEKTSKEYPTKVFKVPIRFNTDYTICMENVGMTTFAPAFIRHGTLLKLNNNRFGNNADPTNLYIKLNYNDVIHNEPNLRFKQPIKLRFDNVPQNKVIHYTKSVYTEIPAQYMEEYYRLNSSAEHVYRKVYDENAYRSINYDNIKENPNAKKGVPNIQPGYRFEYLPNGPLEGLTPANDLFPDEDLYLPPAEGEYYESINPSIGSFDTQNKLFIPCSKDKTIFNYYVYYNNPSDYYYLQGDMIIPCHVNGNTVPYYDDVQYYYISKDTDNRWYELVNNMLIPTSDTYIKADKTYYKKEMTEVPISLNYNITEENCAKYDSIEDELYLLIQVPSSYDPKIVILEGDYTDFPKEKIYDDSKFEVFSNARYDHLFTENLILMETATKQLRPFSPTLIQFLLWHVICNLDTINNDMDRVSDKLLIPGDGYVNYWSDRVREAVYDYAHNHQRKYIRDNLGYITTDIEHELMNNSEEIYDTSDSSDYIDEE